MHRLKDRNNDSQAKKKHQLRRVVIMTNMWILYPLVGAIGGMGTYEHSLHRQGSVESLRGDYVVITFGDPYPLATGRARFRRRFPGRYAVLRGVFLKLGIARVLAAIRLLYAWYAMRNRGNL